MSDQKTSYYKETLQELIEKYKLYVKQCLDIVGDDIDDKISDDKLHNVLKAKRQAAEDAKWAAKEIDLLEKELSGEEVEEEKIRDKNIGFAEMMAK